MNVEKYLNHTFSLQNNNKMTHNHVCLLVCNKKIYSCGTNNSRTSFNFNGNKYKFPSCHAEIEAIFKILSIKKKVKKKFDLYVSRIKNEHFKNSKPCVDCMNFIKNIGCIKRIIYTTGTKEIYNIEKINNINLKNFNRSSGWKNFYKLSSI